MSSLAILSIDYKHPWLFNLHNDYHIAAVPDNKQPYVFATLCGVSNDAF